MHSADTHSDVVSFIFEGLFFWISLQPFTLDPTIELSISSAFRTQMILGWEYLLLGLIVSPLVLIIKILHRSRL